MVVLRACMVTKTSPRDAAIVAAGSSPAKVWLAESKQELLAKLGHKKSVAYGVAVGWEHI